MVVLNELVNRPAKRSLPEDDHPVEASFLDRAHEPLGVGVAVRSPVRSDYDVDPRVLQLSAELVGELRVSIADQKVMAKEESVNHVSQVAGDLGHEQIVGMACRSSDVDSPSPQVDQEQRVVGDQATWSPHLGREEVGRGDLAPVRLEKGRPRRRAIRRGLDALALQGSRDRGSSDPMAEVFESALDARVPPARVLLGQSDDERFDLPHDTTPVPSLLIGPLGRRSAVDASA